MPIPELLNGRHPVLPYARSCHDPSRLHARAVRHSSADSVLHVNRNRQGNAGGEWLVRCVAPCVAVIAMREQGWRHSFCSLLRVRGSQPIQSHLWQSRNRLHRRATCAPSLANRLDSGGRIARGQQYFAQRAVLVNDYAVGPDVLQDRITAESLSRLVRHGRPLIYGQQRDTLILSALRDHSRNMDANRRFR